jgi:hypothetical protein
LSAQDYNLTNEAGPAGTPISLTYNPPVTAVTSSPTSSSASSSSSTAQPLTTTPASPATAIPPILTSQFQYQATAVGQPFVTTINIDGGTPPYHVTVDWGDGTSTDYTFQADPTFQISHTYQQAGNYVITATAVDAKNIKTYVQLAAIIHAPLTVNTTTSGIINSIASSSPAVSSSIKLVRHYLWIVWPGYIIVLVIVFSFWLGEREELRLLHRRKQPGRRS